MRDEFFAKQVSEHVKGGGQPNLNTGWLKEFKIIVPNLEKQKEFDDFATKSPNQNCSNSLPCKTIQGCYNNSNNDKSRKTLCVSGGVYDNKL